MEQRAAARRPSAARSIRNVNLLAPYRDRILQDVKLVRPFKLVVDSRQWDCRRVGARHLPRIRLRSRRAFTEVDGTFPNHHPDPSKPENLKDLIAAIDNTAPNWAWPSTATATGWASSPAAATTSIPTGR